MSLDKFWLQSNNGKQIDLPNLKELKKSDLGNNNALIQLFNIFNTQKADGTAGSDGVLNKSELTSLFNTFNAGANSSKGMSKSVFELNEAEEYLNTTKTTSDKTLSEIGVKAADLFEFLSKLTQNSNTPVNVNNVANDVHLTEEQAQDEVISTISDDTANARTLLMKQDNGHISQLYNKTKELFDSDLSLSNVEEAFMLQEECLENLSKAKEGKLSKREYFLQNREHLKTMMKRRLFRKDENTGLDFLDNNRGKMSKQEFAKFMEDYINEEINKIDRLDSLNKIQHSLLTMGTSGVNDMLKKYQKAAQNKQKTNFIPESKSGLSKTSAIPEKYNTTEPMTFKEVFEIERNQEYSKDRVEAYISQKQKTDFAIGAYNKYQSFKMNSSEILNDYTKSVAGTYAFGGMAAGDQPNPEKQMQKVLEAFESYYANPIDQNSARNEIETLIKDNKLPISVIQDSNDKLSLDLSKLKTDTEKNNVLNKLLKLEDTKLEAKLKTTLGGEVDETLEMFSTNTQIAFTNAYGHDFTNELVQEMSDDNKTFIQKYTGNTSQIGMGLTVVGGILCFTPLAGVGATMVGVGNTMAIGGMVAESALGFEEALSRSNLNPEEIKELSKTLVMNAGGFVVGFKAGQTGMKAFNKLIDKKLAEVFKTEMANGNRAEALKQVFSNPEYLKNFMQAAGVKLSADFVISYAGDLAMMGILDTNDDWKSLLQSNLIGIMTSMGGDLKDVANLGIKGNKAKTIQSYLLETGRLDVNRVHNYTEIYKFTENELIQMQKQYNEKHRVTKTPSTNVQMYVPTVLKEFKDRGFVPEKIFNKILNTQDLDVNAKASCLKYIEQKTKSCTDKFTKVIEIRRAMKTINQILNNSNIDKRCISAILGSYKEKTLLQNYKKLSQYKLEPMTRYTLALMDNVSANHVQKYSEFIDAILKRIDNTPDNCMGIAYFIKDSEGKNFDITKLTEYVKSVDKNKLIEMAPSIKEYSAKQYINFLNFHRQKGVVNFDKKALTLGKNLTEFLEENPIMYSSGTEELLTAYPLTNTRVGSMPEYFNVKDVESNKIFEATEQLANNLELSRFRTVDTNFEQSLLNQYKFTLQSMIKKEITINEIGSGSFGKVYKLSIEGKKPIAIKLFFKNKGDERSGSNVEIPLAIFTNKHFPEHFARFYFGKVPSNSGENGFMVSEFLTPSPEGKFPVQHDKKWSFSYDDGHGWNDLRGNIIGGKICDFGYVQINDKENNTTSVSLKLFEY